MGYEIRDKIKEPTTITDIGNLKIINKNGMYYLEVEFLGETDTSFVTYNLKINFPIFRY